MSARHPWLYIYIYGYLFMTGIQLDVLPSQADASPNKKIMGDVAATYSS